LYCWSRHAKLIRLVATPKVIIVNIRPINDSEPITNNSANTPKSAQQIAVEQDLQVWDHFKSGDEEAFVILYKKYANLLYNYGCQFTDDKELVKDCLQDFFVYLREKRSRLGNTSSVKLYLLKAFKRRVVNYLNKGDKEKEKMNANPYFEFPIEHSFEAIYILQQTENRNAENLKKGLEHLETKEREAVYYFYYQNLSYEQIAELLEFSHVSSARRLIYRALGKLRTYFTSFILLLVGFLF
jgi:RNA polymerase sigma factor (sigma-70 family)